MAGTKKIPERLCVGCRTVHPKKELMRIVRSPEGEISFDPTGKKSGRGAYVCKNAECFHAAIKNHGFSKAFKESVAPALLEELKQELFPENGR